jgi:hypothetical protein
MAIRTFLAILALVLCLHAGVSLSAHTDRLGSG